MSERTVVQEAAKSSQNLPDSRDLYTPQPLRTRVVARHMAGESNRRIASDEGIARETVSRILSQAEVAEMISQHQSQLLTIVPKAIRVFEQALESSDLRIAFAAATKLMEGMRVLNNRPVEQSAPQPDHGQRRIQFLGEMMDMMLEKNRIYGVPLPVELEPLGTQQPTAPEAGGAAREVVPPMANPNPDAPGSFPSRPAV